MSDTTPNLGLPYIMSAQAQKHVTHNEALRALDALVQLSVSSRALASPPASPPDGDRYIVAASATGPWSGKTGQIAAFQDSAWAFFVPLEGVVAWVEDEDLLCVFDGTGWIRPSASVNPAPLVGVNATADATNRLSVSSPASLFSHEGQGHQQKINKHAAGDTASTLYQTNFSGRAEVGLAGDDNLHVKVSPDGSAWKEALLVDRTTGAILLPFSAGDSAFPSPWAGKKWAALGTSITSYGKYTPPLASLLGATLVNLAVDGATIATNAAAGAGDHAIYAAVASIPSDADLVTIEAGCNDFALNSTLGTLADTSLSTFYGALHATAVDVLTNTYRNRTLAFFVPYSFGFTQWKDANGNGNTLAQFQQAVREVAHKFCCPIVDFAESGISTQTMQLYMYDTIHLNTAGGQRYAQFAYNRLRNIFPAPPQVATPTLSLAGGSYEGAQSVTLACATSGATIYYTTDGNLPTTASSVYSGAITISASGTLKAMAVKAGMADSAVGQATYTIVTQVATPTFSPVAGSYTSIQSVAISCATAGATIYYTIDGSTPTTSSSLYSGALTVSATETIKALAVKSGLTDSAIASALYTISLYPASLGPVAWYDPSDLSTLWKDTAGTIPVTADGDAVARIDDKSGNGRHLLQATSGNRPLYKTSGGLSWLQFDGSNDYLKAAATAIGLSNLEIYFVMQQTDETTIEQGIVNVAPASGQDWNSSDGLLITSSFGGNYFSGVGGAPGSVSCNYVGSGNAPLALYEFTKTGTTAIVRKNGDTGSTHFGFTGFNATQTGDLLVGTRLGAAGNFFAGKLYGVMIFNTTLSDRPTLRTWLGNKAGLSI